jgi:uncharacterized protein (TIGR03067 family)
MQTSLIIGLALAVSAPIPKDPPKKDPPSLIGEWLAESAIQGGKPDPPPPGATVTFTKEGKFVVKEGKDTRHEAEFTHDAKKDPAEIDISEGEPGKGSRTMKGIYKIEGDTLLICLTREGERPKTFDSPAGSPNVLVTLKRPKKD